ncbi:MAG TPA: tetratricopeptide repeat protein [Elusimicrobiota bacterium]|nr:tetratricopeptide repeat protein [Elusimicrobiota bacterium]
MLKSYGPMVLPDTPPPPVSAAETEAALKAALVASEKYGRFNHRRLEALESLAEFLVRRERWLEAEPLKLQILSAKEKLYGPEHQSLAPTMAELAVGYEAMGRFDQAEAVLTLALKINERDAMQNTAAIAGNLAGLGRLEAIRGRWSEAETHLVRALKITRIVHGPDHTEMARLLTRWGEAALEGGQTMAAAAKLEEADRIYTHALGAAHPDTANVWVQRGQWARRMGRWAEAESFYRRAMAVHEHREGLALAGVSDDAAHRPVSLR